KTPAPSAGPPPDPVQATCSPLDEEPTQEELDAIVTQLRDAGIDLDAWAAELQAMARAAVEAERAPAKLGDTPKPPAAEKPANAPRRRPRPRIAVLRKRPGRR